ncbi:hypothetical protein HWI79_1593 [Cryptosporidium felis]|nr:hypothetical protein HWI79_1593 [Cryptosporidium felis]
MKFINKSIISLLFLVFGWGVLRSTQESNEFQENILHICKDYWRLKEEQQLQLRKWIDEILSNNVHDIGTRYNLKKCRKAITNQLNNKKTLRSLFSNFFFEKNTRSKDYKLLDDTKLSFKIRDEELEELRKFTEDDEDSDPALRIQKKFTYEDNFLFGKSNIYSSSAMLGTYEKEGSHEKAQSSHTLEGFDNLKMITPHGPISEYLSDEGIPLIMETETLEIKHNPLILLVPFEMPLHFVYVKTPLPTLPPQPRIISKSFITDSEEEEIVELEEADDLQESSSSVNSLVSPEIIDERLDYYDSYEDSSEQSESGTPVDSSLDLQIERDSEDKDGKRQSSTPFSGSSSSLESLDTGTHSSLERGQNSRASDGSFEKESSKSRTSTESESEESVTSTEDADSGDSSADRDEYQSNESAGSTGSTGSTGTGSSTSEGYSETEGSESQESSE